MFRSRRLGYVIIAPLALLACVMVLFVATVSTADTVLEQSQEKRSQCPVVDWRIHPSDIHLMPGLIPHQNWVDFPVPTRFAGAYAFCLDDKTLETGRGVLDFRSGIARFHVATRSINLYWLGGNLDTLRDPSRWELRLVCATNFTCG